MPIPTRVELDQAIRSAQVRLRISDPELKQGSVETVRYETRAGPMEEPWGLEGGFAVVYKYRMRGGRLRALRVFKRLMPADMAQRYRFMHPYFRQHVPACTVECIYHEQGILVKHQNGGQDVYPLLEMEWVEGDTLLECVDRYCAAKDRARLRELAFRWQGLYGDLRAAQVAHGDLSGGNVLVRPDGCLVLIDYDGVFTPDMAQFQAVVGGQPDYQHPQASKRSFSPRMDDFSYLVIYAALLALAADPALWAGHTQRGPRGNLLNENLLFRRDDFERPEQSALMRQLAELPDQDVNRAVAAVKEACGCPVEAVSLPEVLLGPSAGLRQALSRLMHAIWLGDNRAIVECWTDDLARCPQAQIHAPHVRAAKQYLAALARLRIALVTGNDMQIAAACGHDLEQAVELTAAERQRIDLARQRNAALLRFHQALHSDADERIVAEYDGVLDGYAGVQGAQRARLALARQRLDALHGFRVALYRDDDEMIAAAYVTVLDGSPLVEPSERERLALARRRVPALRGLRQALSGDDDERITAAYHPILEGCLVEAEAARRRLDLARCRLKALTAFRQAVIGRDERQIVAAYDPILHAYPKLLPAEQVVLLRARQCLEMPQRVRLALESDDDPEIERAYRPEFDRSWMAFTAEERERIELAQRRVAVLLRLRRALADGDDQAIADAYDPVLDGYSRLADDERAQVEAARVRLAGLQRLRRAMGRGDDEQIVAVWAQIGGDAPALAEAERRRVDLAGERVEALAKLRLALATDDDEHIVQVYNRPLRGYSRLRDEERARVDLARRRLEAFSRLRLAAERGDDEAMLVAYSPILSGRAQMDAALSGRLDLARRRMTALAAFRNALSAGDERAIVAVYDASLLDVCSAVLPEERRRLEESRRCLAYPRALRQALASNDDVTIEAALRPDLERPWMDLSVAEQQRCRLAQDRLAALHRFHAALADGDEQAIALSYDAALLEGYPGVAADERARLDLARACVAMPERLRLAVEAGDDEAVVAAYDPSLLRPCCPVGEALVQAVKRAGERLALRRDVHEALARGALEAALRLERHSGESLADPLLEQAKVAYLRGHEATRLTARLEGDTLTASWRWPRSDLVQEALLAWREDGWPDGPGGPGQEGQLVSRREYDRAGCLRLRVGNRRSLHLRLYAALPGGSDDRRLFAPGDEPTARLLVRRRSSIIYAIEPDGDDEHVALVVETSGGEPLPELRLVRGDAGLPLTAADGQALLALPAGEAATPGHARLRLARADLGPAAHLRLFASDDGSDWRPVSGRITVRTTG
ncbi:MAG: hypothetical protein ACYC5O_14775 [Anaerolineae bacterium]